MVRTHFYVIGFAVLATLAGASAAAQAQTVLLNSKSPYWAVGVRDDKMTRACSLGKFNVAGADRYVARFSGKEGSDTLIVAPGPSNLSDPGKLAKPKETYFFRNANTTECEVFVGGRKTGPVSNPH